jgi:solute carrier family 25 citrate transporter 1
MAIRFVSFEQYKDWLADYTPLGRTTTATFTAGLASGLTEAILVVTPAEVVSYTVLILSSYSNNDRPTHY